MGLALPGLSGAAIPAPFAFQTTDHKEKTPNMNNEIRMDALLPVEMAKKAEDIGVKKANMSFIDTFVLAILAGAFIALGAVFATTVSAGSYAIRARMAPWLSPPAFPMALPACLPAWSSR